MVDYIMILGELGETFTITVIEWIRTLGLLGVFLGVIIESVIIPIPSPLIMMGAGFILLSPDLGITAAIIQLLLIAVVGAFASTLGSYIGYGIGYYGGRPAIQKYKWLFGVSVEELDVMQAKFEARPGAIPGIIFALRAIPIVPLSVMSFISVISILGQCGFLNVIAEAPAIIASTTSPRFLGAKSTQRLYVFDSL